MQFDEQFFQAIGLGSVSDEDRAEMVSKLAELVQGRVAIKLSESLTEEQLAKFDELLESQGDEAALRYVEEVFPQYPEMLQAEINLVKQEFMADVQEAVAELGEPPQEA